MPAYFTNIGEFLAEMENLGMFDYVLPFLLIFAVVYALLIKTKMLGGDDYKGVQAIIALAIGLLALRLEIVSNFFAVLFPRMGVGLAILLVALILLGLFSTHEGSWFEGPNIVFFILASIIAVVVVLSAFSSYDWWYSGFWQEYMNWIIVGILVAIVIGVITSSGPKQQSEKTWYNLIPPKGKQ